MWETFLSSSYNEHVISHSSGFSLCLLVSFLFMFNFIYLTVLQRFYLFDCITMILLYYNDITVLQWYYCITMILPYYNYITVLQWYYPITTLWTFRANEDVLLDVLSNVVHEGKVERRAVVNACKILFLLCI